MLTLRMRSPHDEGFYRDLYSSTRSDERQLIHWSDDEWQAFIDSQYMLQERAYLEAYPTAQDHVIELNGQPAGRWLIWTGDQAIGILDVTILPEFRRQGIATHLIRELQMLGQKHNKAVWATIQFNQSDAERLFTKLEFVMKQQEGISFLFEWPVRSEA